jgi:hypothetical protein
MYGNPALYGAGGDVFLVFNLMKSLAETDKSIIDSDKFASALGAAGMQKVSELDRRQCREAPTNLFAINPRESNPIATGSRKIPPSGKASKLTRASTGDEGSRVSPRSGFAITVVLKRSRGVVFLERKPRKRRSPGFPARGTHRGQ